MPKRLREADLQAIETAVRQYSEGASAREIGEMLPIAVPHRTLQYRLNTLVRAERLVMEGSGRRARYRIPKVVLFIRPNSRPDAPLLQRGVEVIPPLSEAGVEIGEYVSQPVGGRKPVGYDPSLLLSYQPNDTFYLSQAEREHLRETGQSGESGQPGGTHAKNILDRLLIDLSWNSSRLEGNTYSLLETSRLLELGQRSRGKKSGAKRR